MSLIVDIEKKLNSFTLKINFECGDEIVAFLGSSGAGKSMTLKCIAGIERPDRGKIILDGRTLYDSEKGIYLTPQKRNVGYLFQDFALFPNMTVYQNVYCSIRKDSKRYSVKDEVVLDILKKLDILDIKDSHISEISGGQKQRVALARILVNEAEIIMLDEPFSSLDEHLKFQLQNELSNIIREYGKTVLFITHDRDEAYRLCDRIAIIDKGKIDVYGTVEEVFLNPVTVLGARLTGVKNISEALPSEGETINAIDWNLYVPLPANDEKINAIGIRMHSLKPVSNLLNEDDTGSQIFIEGIICEIRNTPFTYVIGITNDGFKRALYFEINKDDFTCSYGEKVTLSIDKKNIMLLYDSTSH